MVVVYWYLQFDEEVGGWGLEEGSSRVSLMEVAMGVLEEVLLCVGRQFVFWSQSLGYRYWFCRYRKDIFVK